MAIDILVWIVLFFAILFFITFVVSLLGGTFAAPELALFSLVSAAIATIAVRRRGKG